MRGVLGRVPSRHDPRTFRLANYLADGQYAAPPPARDWISKTRFSWFENSSLGTCTCAALCHMLQAHATQQGVAMTISDADVLAMYSAIGGYVVGHPETDRGAQMIDALRYLKSTGIAGHKVGAYVRVDTHNLVEVRAAINLFGGLYVGANMPNRVTSQVVWDLVPVDERDTRDDPGSMGGHAFTLLKYDRLHYGLATWATTYAAANAWVDMYVDEAWAIIEQTWVADGKLAPNGFDVDRLQSDLARL